MRRALVVAVLLAAAAAEPAPGAGVRCPAALPLGRNAIAPASRVALSREAAASRPQVVAVALAPQDHPRGDEARRQCGRGVWRRTVVVHITLRALLPSASLSERVDFVARTKRGWRVWEVVH